MYRMPIFSGVSSERLPKVYQNTPSRSTRSPHSHSIPPGHPRTLQPSASLSCWTS